VCTGCQDHFGISDGLIDLCRGEANLSILFLEDVKRAEILRSRSSSLGIAELIRLCYQLPGSRTPSMLDKSVDFMLRGQRRMEEALDWFAALARQRGWSIPKGGVVLDLGCGVGTSTGYLTTRFDRVFAVNPAWDEMVVGAEKVNREWFDGRLVLIRAFGEFLPFRDQTFDLVCGLDIMEHVAEPAKVLIEVERVLKPGGLFIFNSVNQYNIMTADGHVQIKYVGFLPETMRESYVRWRTGMSWKMRNVHPLSYWKLNRFLKKLKYSDFHHRIFGPTGKSSDWKRKLAQSVPGIRFLAKWFILILGGMHHVVVRKND
jgi:SAM-dependent methyltransferase